MNTCRKYFLIWCILINLHFACKKEKDTQPPVISILSPFENQTFYADEDVVIQGTITDETVLEKASVTLLNDRGQPVHRTLSIAIASKNQILNLSYLLDNIHLESGTYKLSVFASDGKNDSHTDISIYIVGVPKVLDKIVIATASTTSQTDISMIDSTGTIIPFTNFSGDHLDVSVNSYFQELFHCGSASGNFSGISLSDKRIVVNVPCVPSSSVPYFTGFFAENNNYYMAFYNEQIMGYDHTGNIIYNAKALPGYFAKQLWLNDQHLIVEQQNKITDEQRLVCYFSTGAAQQNCTLTQEVVAFFERDETHILVFGNKAGQGVIQEYDRIANNLWSPYPYTLTYGTVTCAIKLDDDSFLLACSNGNIYKYAYSTSSVTLYLTGYEAIQMVLDDLNNAFYVVEKNKINKLDMQGKPIQVYNSTAAILKIGLLYNK